MLHLLDAGIDDQPAGRNHRAGKLGDRGRAASAADQENASGNAAG